MSSWTQPLSAEDHQAIENAYNVLTRIGRETAGPGGEWDEYLDSAHQYLGLILVFSAGRVRFRTTLPHQCEHQASNFTPCPTCGA